MVTTSELSIRGYILYMDEGLGGPFQVVYDGRLNPKLVEYRVNGLIPGRTYRFKVKAVDYNGQGSESDPSSFVSCVPPSGVK